MALTGTSPYFIAVGVLQMIFAVIIIICSGIVLDTFLPSRYAALAILGLFVSINNLKINFLAPMLFLYTVLYKFVVIMILTIK